MEGERMQGFARLGYRTAVLTAWIAALAAALPAAAGLVLTDPGSELYYTLAVTAGDEVKIDKFCTVTGDVHSNKKVSLETDGLVDGDVSASVEADLKGTVTGTVASPVPARTLPVLLDEAQARALAEQIYEGDHDFIDATIDQVVFVDGKARFIGSIGGVGTVIASGDIEVKEVPLGSGPGLLAPGTQLSLIAFKSLKLEKARAMRGALYAGTDVILQKNATFDGTAVARGKVDVQEGTQVTFLDLDPVPPGVTIAEPVADSIVATAMPTIRALFSDDLSGIDVSTARLVVDGVDRTPSSVVSAAEVSFTPAAPLADGAHQVAVSVSDHSANPAAVQWSFVSDTAPPLASVTRPDSAFVVADVVPLLAVAYPDVTSGADLETVAIALDGGDLTGACALDPESAVCRPAGLANGAHQLTLDVADRAGNHGTASFAFAFVLDRDPPLVVIAQPADNALTGTPEQTVAGTVSDDSGIVTAVRVDGRAVPLVDGAFSTSVVLDQGSNVLRVEAFDSTGKVGATEVAVVLDLEAPDLTIETPRDGAATNAEEVTVAGRVSDGYGIAQVEVAGTPVTPTDGRFETRVTLAEGVNHIVARAIDPVGNAVESAVDVEMFRLPDVTIATPADLSTVAATTAEVSGTVSSTVVAVDVNGFAADLADGVFTVEVPLIEGGNVLTASAADGGGRVATDSINVVRDLTPPRIAVDQPRDGARTAAAAVSVSGLVNDIVAGTVNASEVQVLVDGAPARVTNRSFVADGVPLVAGDNLITVEATDEGGNRRQVSLHVERVAAPGPRISAVAGDRQAGVVGQPLPAPLVAEVRDAAGLPVAGVPVLFKVVGSDGVLDTGARSAAATTGTDGRAAIGFTLGSRAGVANQTVQALASGYQGPAVFRADAEAGEASLIVVDSGGQQVGVAGRELPRPLIAAVTDGGFNRLPGVPVTFRVARGDGRFRNGEQELTALTDSDGRAIAPFALGSEGGEGSDVVNATIVGLAGGPLATFTSTARVAGPAGGTSISGVVLDNASQPVPGVTLRILGTTFTTTTDASGSFRIAPAPVGTVKLIFDGSTTGRPGAWPDLEFVLTTVPGVDNTLGMPVFLLPLDLDHGLYVSETQGGVLELPDIPGFALEVDAGSATFPSGSKSGLISVTAVHSDRVPMTPNFGQQPRLIVTIQPAGTRFDPPARLVLPNVEGLAPGSITEMYSFDHDLGHFVSIGPATVSADGTLIRSNPGVGVLKAGWHCGGNPATSGTTHDCPQCRKCENDNCVSDPGQDGSSCDDMDECTADDVCNGGNCRGEPRRIRSVDAQVEGQDMASVAVEDDVDFAVVDVDQDHCDPLTYEWDFGDGGTGSGQTTTHAYMQPGNYTATATVICGPCDRERQQDSVSVEVKDWEVEIVKPMAGKMFDMDPAPQMPDIDAEARINGLDPDPTPSTSFDWTVTLKLNGTDCSHGVNRQIADETLMDSVTGGPYMPTFSNVRGGKMEMKVEATIGSKTDDDMVDMLEIRGTNPQKTAVRGRLPHDTLRRIACHESGMRQFQAGANGGKNKCPLFSGDGLGGVGIMQITNPAPTIDEHWDWKANVDRGIQVFNSKAPYPVNYPGQLQGGVTFGMAVMLLNQDRQARGLQPLSQVVVPAFTSGDFNTNLQQRQLDQVRAYNGYGGRLLGWPLHEYRPQMASGFLDLQVDPATLVGTVVWEQVPAADRPQNFGDPNYVANIQGEDPTCP